MAIETYHYGCRDMKIATWTAANSYGTPVDIVGAREFTLTLRTQADELAGDDVIVDTFAKVIGISARMSWGSVNQQVLDIISGGTLVSNATYEDVLLSQNDTVPYFAVAVSVVGTGSGTEDSDLHIFIPKCKIAGDLSYQAQQNGYLIPQVDVRGVYEGTVNGFARVRKFLAATALAIPLATS